MNSFPSIKVQLFVLLSAIAVSFISCVKEEDTKLAIDVAAATAINFDDASGVLDAIRNVSYVNTAGFEVPIETNSAVAAFTATPGSSTLLDAGTVKLNEKALTKYDNNSYVYQDLLSPLDLSTVTWQVDGNGSIPVFTKTVSKSVPSFSGYSLLPTSITKSSGVTINLSGQVSSADSVYVVIADYQSKWIIKRIGGTAGSASFTASELEGLAVGNGLIQISAFNLTAETISNKKFYFVNQAVYSRGDVTIE